MLLTELDIFLSSKKEYLMSNGMNASIAGASVMLGLAVGDALGAPHEFNPPLPPGFEITMSGGGLWEAGEWTDDTAMAIGILLAWVKHGEFGSKESLDSLVEIWQEWAIDAPDVGIQTRGVLQQLPNISADAAWQQAEDYHERMGQSAGNGSLMRTAPLALLDVPDAELTRIVSQVSLLTHFEQDATDACVLWTHAIRNTLKNGLPDTRFEQALLQIPDPRRALWRERIEEAHNFEPYEFANNGWVVSAFQAALSAVVRSEGDFVNGVKAAVRCGNDTDTVAAIAGSLLGAWCGEDAIPREWLEPLHGWPWGAVRNQLTSFIGPSPNILRAKTIN